MYEQTLRFGDEAFAPVTNDADRVLQKLLKNMMEKGSSEGSLTIKIDVAMVMDVVQNFDPDIEGDTRKVLRPKLSHKVSSVMQIKDESKGNMNNDGYELVWDETLGEYILKPIEQAQQSIFDVEYTVVQDSEEADPGPTERRALGSGRKNQTPFEYLCNFIGEEMRVSCGDGYYAIVTSESEVIVSSVFEPTDRFFCPVEKLKPHYGHRIVCAGYGDDQIVNVSIECTDCNKVIFDIDIGDGEDPAGRDLPDVDDGGYGYEPPQK